MGSAEAAGGNYWSRPCIRLMPVTICSSETGRGCCPHPRVTAVAKKDRNRRAACPLPGQRLSIFSVFRKSRARQCSTFLLARGPRSRKSTASGQGEESWKEKGENRKRRRSESGGYGFASAGEPLLPSGFFSPNLSRRY